MTIKYIFAPKNIKHVGREHTRTTKTSVTFLNDEDKPVCRVFSLGLIDINAYVGAGGPFGAFKQAAQSLEAKINGGAK
jgi:hypothetical protein